MSNLITPQELKAGDVFTAELNADQIITCTEDYNQERKGLTVKFNGFLTSLTFNGCSHVRLIKRA